MAGLGRSGQVREPLKVPGVVGGAGQRFLSALCPAGDCYRDYAQANARPLADLLKATLPGPDS